MLLSKCTNPNQVFLYDGETVALQYILRMIWNDEKLPEIRAVEDDSNFDDAVSNILREMYADIQAGVKREDYELNNINSKVVTVDITKEDIEKINDYTFKIKEK